jgi:phosphatidylglycerophosphate synthase
MSWPNRITVFRLLLVTPFILLLLQAADSPMYRYGAMTLALVMGIGDAVDGILARRLGAVSKIGSILDPLADYALTISALITMSIPGVLSTDPDVRLPYWVSVTLVARAVFMLVGMAIVYFMSGFFQGLPSLTGKAATVLQFTLVVLMCLVPDLLPLAPDTVHAGLNALWIATVVLGVASWLGYIRTGSKLLTAGNHGA